MRIIKYRPHSIQRRDLSPYIDYDNSNISIQDNYLVFFIVTNKPHRLADGDRILISKTGVSEILPIRVMDKKSFKIYSPSKTSIVLSREEEYSDSETLITLNGVIEHPSSSTFCIYHENDMIFSGCTFPTNIDGDSLYNQIIVPVVYQEGRFADYGDLSVANNAIAEWENGETPRILSFDFIEVAEYMTINVPFTTNFASNLNQEEIFNEQISDEIKSETVPDLIDMEKQMFEPYIKLSDNTYIPVSSITIDMHFKKRDTDNNWAVSATCNSLSTANASLAWNPEASGSVSDSLTELGFEDDDVKYQKNRLKKSFLRLLFYDSNDITNQNLLFYSTIFIDSNSLYNEYMKNLVIDSTYTLANSSTTFTRIDSELTVYNRYNYTKSSEGFYLYMYPTDVDENDFKTIYMKAEFNNAKYGKTIPLTLPLSGNTILSFTSTGFPKTYIVNKGTKNKPILDVDMAKYYQDLFIPVNIEFNKSLNKYIYYFPWNVQNKDRGITLTLFEPRVNGSIS